MHLVIIKNKNCLKISMFKCHIRDLISTNNLNLLQKSLADVRVWLGDSFTDLLQLI